MLFKPTALIIKLGSCHKIALQRVIKKSSLAHCRKVNIIIVRIYPFRALTHQYCTQIVQRIIIYEKAGTHVPNYLDYQSIFTVDLTAVTDPSLLKTQFTRDIGFD